MRNVAQHKNQESAPLVLFFSLSFFFTVQLQGTGAAGHQVHVVGDLLFRKNMSVLNARSMTAIDDSVKRLELIWGSLYYAGPASVSMPLSRNCRKGELHVVRARLAGI